MDKDVVHIANGILIIERNEIASFVNMDGLRDCHTEWNKSEREKEKSKCHILTNMESRKMVQFSSVTQSCLTLCNPMDCSMPSFPVLHQLPQLAQTHVHCVGDATQPSHPLSSPSLSAFNLSQHQGLFQWVSSLSQVTKVLEFQL